MNVLEDMIQNYANAGGFFGWREAVSQESGITIEKTYELPNKLPDKLP